MVSSSGFSTSLSVAIPSPNLIQKNLMLNTDLTPKEETNIPTFDHYPETPPALSALPKKFFIPSPPYEINELKELPKTLTFIPLNPTENNTKKMQLTPEQIKELEDYNQYLATSAQQAWDKKRLKYEKICEAKEKLMTPLGLFLRKDSSAKIPSPMTITEAPKQESPKTTSTVSKARTPLTLELPKEEATISNTAKDESPKNS